VLGLFVAIPLKDGCEKLNIDLFLPVIYANNPARMALISNLSKPLEMPMELFFGKHIRLFYALI